MGVLTGLDNPSVCVDRLTKHIELLSPLYVCIFDRFL